jgi:hypothetical protein
MRWMLAVLLLSLTAPALACRCAERDLAEYFDSADEVAVGRLLSARQLPPTAAPVSLELAMELLAPTFRPIDASGPRAGDRRRYLTPGSSAGCGILPELNAVYLMFAHRDRTDGTLTVNSCSGTRVLMPANGSDPAGFRDVPPRFVMQQLNGLAGMSVLQQLSGTYPDETDPGNDVLIGLLDIESLSHAGFARLHERPDSHAPVIAEVSTYEELQFREVSYESPAAVVVARQGEWYRLQMKDGRFGWLPPDDAGTYFAYDQLPVRRLAYLRSPWHGFLWPAPGAGMPLRATAQRGAEQPVEVFESRRIGGSLWFRVALLGASHCEAAPATSGLSGWIPAYGLSLEPLVWFYARGC